jgi:hypothetical protein
MHTPDREGGMEIAQGDSVLMWIEKLEIAEEGLVAHGPDWLREDSPLVQGLSDLAQTDPVARRLAADTQLRYRWDAVWAATDSEA